MRKLSIFLFTTILMVLVSSCSKKFPDNFVFVDGGTFKNTKSNYYGKNITVPSFYIGRCEVTQKEWIECMGRNPSQFQGDDFPVETVSWYDCVEYCNKRSIKESLQPYYNIDKNNKDPNNQTDIDDLKWMVTINAGANGYRLPTEVEWEYAAGGGQLSKSCIYSGSDNLDEVAWYWQNCGDAPLTGQQWNWPAIKNNNCRTRPVGSKKPNELGLYDMSGNVREWCWDWYGDLKGDGTLPKASTSETGRVWKGGGWIGGDFCCAPSFRNSFEASGKGPDQGFRVCRSK
jgi:sulfatase modifying factor 1